MRKSALLLLVACTLASCDDEPTGRPTSAVDALWKLAPDGSRFAIVLSPYAIGMIEAGSLSLRSFIVKAGMEMAAFDAQLDSLLEPVGGKGVKLADLGLTATKGGALFFVKDGMLAVLPIADRDAFLAKAHGTKAETAEGIDKINGNACKQMGPHYVCATTEAILATTGKSAIMERLAKLKTRGDIEMVLTELPLQGPDNPRSSIVATAQLERGAWVMRGLVGNPPANIAGKLSSSAKPRTRIGKSAGFAVFDLRPFIESSDAVVTEGVTQAQLVKSMAGPVTLDVAAGSTILDMQQPLSDPKPFTKVVEHCGDIDVFKQLGATFKDGICHVALDQMNLDLDMWMDGNTLHIGKKGAQVTDVSVSMPPVATELATGSWGFAFWGRGTMFAPTEKPPTEPQGGVNPMVTTPLRTMSMLDEVGFGVKQDGTDLRFVFTMRTAFANPVAVLDQLTDITAMDVLGNKAAAKAKPIAEANPSSPFAGDFAAGQHGLVIPTQMLFTGMSMLIPAILHFTRGNRAETTTSPQAPPEMPLGTITRLRVKGYATDGLEMWKKKNPGKTCPATMAELAAAVDPQAVFEDEWGKEFVMVCGGKLPEGAKGIAIVSPGPDGKLGTADDIKSY